MTFLEVDTLHWPRVELAGVTYAVAPRYVGPMSIGEADETAKHHGCELPTPALVDAIWKSADCKLDGRRFVRKHDGTPATMSSPAVMLDQSQRIERAIAEWEASNGPARLVAGCAKDVVRMPNGKLALYGWHDREGRVIQPAFSGHARAWQDYSQMLRLVRRVEALDVAA